MRKWMAVAAAAFVLIPGAALYLDHSWGRAEASVLLPPPPPIAAEPAKPAAPVALPPPRPVWSKAGPLQAAVTKAMADFPGEYSVVVHELRSGEQWAVNPDQRYHPASTIKMPVTLYALEQFRAGKLGWQDGITYTQADFESPGGGAFETAPFGGVYPVENLVGRALRYSNNVAVNMLGRHLGWENIRAWTRSINGTLYRADDGQPQVTALSELGWWLHLERLSRTDPKNAERVLQPLREVAYDGRIAAGLPEGTQYLHKFGSYNGYFHDGGWVMGENPFLLVVMTHGATEDQADAAIAQVAAAVCEVMVK
ncbi:MAG TPA: serine hydrolase [Symbiobacteriaceae bacterium]|nr:serine hydrolase [Symbiobacteriaceae bacterium]